MKIPQEWKYGTTRSTPRLIINYFPELRLDVWERCWPYYSGLNFVLLLAIISQICAEVSGGMQTTLTICVRLRRLRLCFVVVMHKVVFGVRKAPSTRLFEKVTSKTKRVFALSHVDDPLLKLIVSHRELLPLFCNFCTILSLV